MSAISLIPTACGTVSGLSPALLFIHGQLLHYCAALLSTLFTTFHLLFSYPRPTEPWFHFRYHNPSSYISFTYRSSEPLSTSIISAPFAALCFLDSQSLC